MANLESPGTIGAFFLLRPPAVLGGTDPPPALHNDPLGPAAQRGPFSERFILGKLPESEIEQTVMLLHDKLMPSSWLGTVLLVLPEPRTPPVAPTGFCFAGTFKEGIRETLFFHNHAQAIRSDIIFGKHRARGSRTPLCRRQWRLLPNFVRGPLRNHDGRRIDVATDQVRKDRRIDHT
jgi:hypothetical protein